MPNLWDDCYSSRRAAGTVRLASRDPMAKPEIDPRYLSELEDVDTLIAGLRIAQRDARAAVLKPWAETIFPAANASDAELAAFIPGDIAGGERSDVAP